MKENKFMVIKKWMYSILLDDASATPQDIEEG
jgi:hypothetical protein